MKSYTSFMRTSIIALLAGTSFLAMYVAGSFFFPYIVGKNVGFRTLVEIALILYIPLAIIAPKYRPTKSKGLYVYAAFIAVLLVADIFGVNPQNSLFSNFERMEGFITHLHLFTFTCILVFIRLSKKEWYIFIWLYLTGNALVLLQSFGEINTISNKLAAGEQVGTRIAGTLGNPAYLAIYTVFGIFFAGLLLVQRWGTARIIEKTLYVSSILFNTIILWRSETRGTVLGLIAGFGVGMFFYIAKPYLKTKQRELGYATLFGIVAGFIASRFLEGSNLLITLVIIIFCAYLAVLSYIIFLVYKKRLSKKHTIVTILVSLGTLAVMTFPFFTQTSFVQNSPTLKRLAAITLTEQTVRSRFMIWEMSLEGVKERPILGWGQDNFGYVFAKHYNPEMFDQEQWFDRSHNVFFDWMIAAGITGLVAYLMLFVSSIWMTVRAKGDLSTEEQALVLGILTAYFVHNIFVFDNLVSYIGFFTLYAFLLSRTIPEYIQNKKNKTVSGLNTKFWIISLVSTLSIFVFWYITLYKPMKLNTSIINMYKSAQSAGGRDALSKVSQRMLEPALFGNAEAKEQYLTFINAIVQSKLPDQDKEYFFREAVKVFQTEIQNDPKNPRPAALFGGFLEGLGLHSQAATTYEKALDATPTKTLLWLELAKSYYGAEDNEKAIATATKSFDLSNRSLTSAGALASLLYQKGDTASLDQVWKKAVEANKESVQSYGAAINFYKGVKNMVKEEEIVSEMTKKYPNMKKELNESAQ